MAKQSAVIPFWYDPKKQKYRFVLIKALTNQDFIIPKGKIEPHLSASESAAKEAEEEAGVLGQSYQTPIAKWERNHKKIPVYLLEVHRLLHTYKEDYRPRVLVYEDEYRDMIADKALLEILDKTVIILQSTHDYSLRKAPVWSWTEKLNALYLYLQWQRILGNGSF
ncbi:MAG: NUDIX domain-containing protein [Microscillaceae bacterium]|nr:NUDIX domain-containing protein [Microscillaceae bacterium]